MKNEIRLFKIIAIVAMIGFGVIACDDNGDDHGNGNGNGEFAIAGSFAYEGNNAEFYANHVSNSARAVAGLSSAELELEGKIEDGDIIFNLKGYYNTKDNNFYLSAGSSFLIYQIAGTLSTENMVNTQATIKIKDGSDWNVHNVTVTGSSNVSIDGSASADQENGIPTPWFGTWENKAYFNTVDGHGSLYTFTAWQFIDHSMPEQTAGILDVKSLGGGKLEMIWEGSYITGFDDTGMIWETKYRNIWLEENGTGGLTFTAFADSFFDTYAEAEAFVSGSGSVGETQTFTRFSGGTGSGGGASGGDGN